MGERAFNVNALPDHPIFRGVGISSKLADIEAILGLAFTGFVTFGVAIGVPFGVIQFMVYERPHPPAWLWAVLGPVGLLVVWLQWKTLQALGAGLEHAPHPRPVFMAMSQRHWPIVLRLIVAAWWLGQVAIVVAVAEALSRSYGFVNPPMGVRAFQLALQLTILFMGAYACTCSMLFAVAAVRRSEALLTALWRARVFIDLAIAIGVAYIGSRLND
jgi:hypothetical protein